MIRILVGDCRRLLRSIAADSVQTVVTSPPYYGLRDWGTEGEVWGGDPKCAHAWGEDVVSPRKSGGDGSTSTLGTASGGNAISQAGILRSIDRSKHQGARSNFCRHCGAWRGTLGLEPDYRMFIDNLVEVFREVRRVLRPDGLCWLNLGDSYATGAGAVRDHPGGGEMGERWRSAGHRVAIGKHAYLGGAVGSRGTGGLTQPNRHPQPGLKPKDQMMIPARVAIALCDDGWFLRQDIIWSKPSAMPESITDRCTKSHEHVFLLAKNRRYYYDHVAIMEMSSENTRPRTGKNSYLNEDHVPRTRKNDATNGSHMPGAAPHTGIHRAGKPRGGQLVGVNPKALWDGVGPKPKQNASYSAAISAVQLVEMRNKRDVWTIATEPFKDAHFATMPSALVEPCILAATSDRGACPTCGTGWRRVTRKVPSGRKQKMADGWDTGDGGHGTIHRDGREAGEPDQDVMVTETVGWYPACDCYGVDKLPRYPDRPKDRPAMVRWRAACEAVYRVHLDLAQKALPLPTRPCVVLDPFFGAGTVGLVADRLQRDAIGMDLNLTYAEMARRRIVGDEIGPLLPTTVEVQHDPINNDPR